MNKNFQSSSGNYFKQKICLQNTRKYRVPNNQVSYLWLLIFYLMIHNPGSKVCSRQPVHRQDSKSSCFSSFVLVLYFCSSLIRHSWFPLYLTLLTHTHWIKTRKVANTYCKFYLDQGQSSTIAILVFEMFGTFSKFLTFSERKTVEQKISTFKSLKVRSILLIFASISKLFLGLKSHTAFYTPIVFVYN